MKRNPAKDNQLFNCHLPNEIEHVVSQYPGYEAMVRTIITQGCSSGAIQYYTHLDVYNYVQRQLGLDEH